MRQRLLLSYLTLTVFLLAVLEIPLALNYASRERQDLTSKVERDAVALATMASPGRSPQLEAIARRYREQTGGRVLIVGPKGRRVYDSGPGLGGTSFASRPEIARALDGQVATGTRFSSSLGHDLIYVAVPVAAEGQVRGAVRITYPTSTVDARVHRYWLILVAIAALVLSAALAIGLLFARSIARPLEALRAAAARAGGGDLSTRAPVGLGPPEVRAVAVAFNDTVAKLDALVHAQDEFVADASHQLRSPLDRASPPAREPRARRRPTRGGPASRALHPRSSDSRESSTACSRLPVQIAHPRRPTRSIWRPSCSSGWRRGRPTPTSAMSSSASELVPVVALGTPGRLEQVLDNLLANALDVAPAGSDDHGVALSGCRGRRAARDRRRAWSHGGRACACIRSLLARRRP